MYICNDCKARFSRPRNVFDDIRDEDYDVCPKCDSQNYQTIEYQQSNQENHDQSNSN